jgi:hypothetical protein
MRLDVEGVDPLFSPTHFFNGNGTLQPSLRRIAAVNLVRAGTAGHKAHCVCHAVLQNTAGNGHVGSG